MSGGPFHETPLSQLPADRFRPDLVEALRKIAPKEWPEAERSSGNMHNPKILPLWKHLSTASMQTTLAKNLSRDLAKHGLKIAEFTQEKLRYEKHGDQRKILGIFYIRISPE